MDFSVLQKLGSEAKYASQKNEYDVRFAPTSAGAVQGESDEILTKTVVIHFFPNSWDVSKKITRSVDGKDVEELYDPNVGFVVEEIGKLAGQYGAARIVIEGHTDASMRNQAPKSAVQELSLNRANSVKEAIVKKFATLQPNQFSTSGLGWDRTCRSRRSRQQREEPARRDQGLPRRSARRREVMGLFELRASPPRTVRYLLGAGGLALLLLVWWLVTIGPVETRSCHRWCCRAPLKYLAASAACSTSGRSSRASPPH
jgi:hypothetical protein